MVLATFSWTSDFHFLCSDFKQLKVYSDVEHTTFYKKYNYYIDKISKKL